MKREDVKNKIPGITEEQLAWIMTENGNDVNREKSAAQQLKVQLDNANAQLTAAQEGLAAFDGKKKPEEYEADLAKLRADLQAQAQGFAFDNALDTAILAARGRSEYKGGWEFPGGKIEPGETPQQALKREIREELDTETAVGDLIGTVEYDYSTFHLSMDCFWCEVVSGKLMLKEAEAARWLTREELDSVPWLPSNQFLLAQIRPAL